MFSMHAFYQFTELLTYMLLFLIEQQEPTGTEEEETVTNITIYHTKEDGECRSSEKGRVGLPMTWDTTCLDILLVSVVEFVGNKVSRRS
jgi:hypothetical protein